MFPDCSPGVEAPLVGEVAGLEVGLVHQGAEHGAERGAVEVGASSPASTGRAATIARLSAELRALAEAGDIEGARIVNQTIGALLGGPASTGEGRAAVVDLDAERRRRGRR